MNAIERMLQQEIREKKTTAYGARHVKRGSRSKKCTLPSDWLSPKQLRERNGAVMTWEMNKPVSFNVFRAMPKDIAQEYLDNLNNLSANLCDASKMMGVSAPTLRNFIVRNGLSFAGKQGQKKTNDEAARWEKFLAGEEPEMVDNQEDVAARTNDSATEKQNDTKTFQRNLATVTLLSGRVSFEGNIFDIASKLVQWVGADSRVRVTVDFEVVE